MKTFEGGALMEPEPSDELEAKESPVPPETESPLELLNRLARQPSLSAEDRAKAQAEERAKHEAIINQFVVEQAKQLAKAKSLFGAKTLEEFEGILPLLQELLEAYQQKTAASGENQYYTRLPVEIVTTIVDPDYIIRKERELKEVGNKEGIYFPKSPLGGGDYIERTNGGGRVGEIKIFDFVGHGEKALWTKAFMVKWLELRRTEPDATRESLFAELDNFIISLPVEGQTAEFAEVEFEPSELGIKMTVETAGGGIKIFTRTKIEDEPAKIEILKLDNYTWMGMGKISSLAEENGGGRILNEFILTPGTEVLVSSDGLFDIRLSTDENNYEMFGDENLKSETLLKFAADHAHLSNEKFELALKASIRQADEDGRRKDDVTVLMIKPEQFISAM